MDFLLFLKANEKTILELVYKSEYSVEENTPLCLLGDKFFGFLKKKQKRIVICTENAKNYGGYYFPKINKDDDFDKTGIYIRRALRHEAVHIAQACNDGKVINIAKIKMHPFKMEALEGSTKVSGARDKEYEAYSLEDKPRLIIKALKKYCL